MSPELIAIPDSSVWSHCFGSRLILCRARTNQSTDPGASNTG